MYHLKFKHDIEKIFVFKLNNGIDLDYLWIANAKIYNDSVGEVPVLWVWIINEVRTAHIALLNDANCCGFSGVRWAANTQAKQIECVDLFI